MRTRTKTYDYKPKSPAILAIDPGLAHTGYALVKDGKLVIHGVWEHQGAEEFKEILEETIQMVALDELVLEWPTFIASHHTDAQSMRLRELFDVAMAAQQTSKSYGIPVYGYSPATIRSVVTGDKGATKEQVAFVLSLFYPELAIYRTQGSRKKEKHWLHMTDALAAAQCRILLFDEPGFRSG